MTMDHIIKEASGTPEWDISLGTNLTKTGLIYCEVLIVMELIIYAILFKHLHDHNLKAEKSNLGLSKEILNQRKRKNVISFVGEFISFVIECSVPILIQLMVAYNFNHSLPIIGPFLDFALVIAFFVSSPEIRRFYFNSNTVSPTC